MNGKAWYASKTIWFSIIYFGSAILFAVANLFGYADFTPPAEVADATVNAVDLIRAAAPALFGLIGTIWLRLKTREPIE